MESNSRKKISKPVIIAIIGAMVILVGVGGYFFLDRFGYIKTFQLAMQLQQQQGQQLQQQGQNQAVMDSLAKIMLLPTDVAPTMAVINNIETLQKEQPVFFSDAKNGEYVIIYPNMAIIYDYEANKIVRVGPVQITQPGTQQQISGTTPGTEQSKNDPRK